MSDSTKYRAVTAFGSSFAGYVCDDGPVTQGPWRATLEEAKQDLAAICRQSRCLDCLADDGMSAYFCNWNGSPTGRGRIESSNPNPTPAEGAT